MLCVCVPWIFSLIPPTITKLYKTTPKYLKHNTINLFTHFCSAYQQSHYTHKSTLYTIIIIIIIWLCRSLTNRCLNVRDHCRRQFIFYIDTIIGNQNGRPYEKCRNTSPLIISHHAAIQVILNI